MTGMYRLWHCRRKALAVAEPASRRGGPPLPACCKQERAARIALDTLTHQLANPGIWTVNGVDGKQIRRSDEEVEILVRFVASGLVEMLATPDERRRHTAR